MKGSLLLYNSKLNCSIFSTGLNGSLIRFIRTYTVNYRNALDRLRVRMNIILLIHKTAATVNLLSTMEFQYCRYRALLITMHQRFSRL